MTFSTLRDICAQTFIFDICNKDTSENRFFFFFFFISSSFWFESLTSFIANYNRFSPVYYTLNDFFIYEDDTLLLFKWSWGRPQGVCVFFLVFQRKKNFFFWWPVAWAFENDSKKKKRAFKVNEYNRNRAWLVMKSNNSF